MDFEVRCPLVRYGGAFYSVFVHRLARLLNASFRPRLAAVALASSLGLYLHQVDQRTFTSKLLSMPSTQRSRFAADAIAWPKQATSEIRDWAIRDWALRMISLALR